MLELIVILTDSVQSSDQTSLFVSNTTINMNQLRCLFRLSISISLTFCFDIKIVTNNLAALLFPDFSDQVITEMASNHVQ